MRQIYLDNIFNRIRFVAFSIFLTFFCSANSQLINVEKIQHVLDSLVVNNKLPGLNFSLINAQGLQQNFSSGYENIKLRKRVNKRHFMLSGSIGKTYAAACVFQLIDEGKIELQDKLSKYIDNYEWLVALPNYSKITVEMLLNHTSGLPRWVLNPEIWRTLHSNPDKEWTYKDRLQFLFNKKSVHQPGKGWAYSDTNYILLAMLLESADKKAYYKILKDRLLDKYNLKETVPSNKRKIKNLAMGYSKLPESFKIPNEVLSSDRAYVFNPQMEWSGGGIASTTSDLAKWGNMYFRGNIFSDFIKNKMIRIEEICKNVYQNKHSYGLGSFIYHTGYGKAYGHSGFMPGYNSIVAYYPNYNITIALQINADYANQKMSLINYLDIILNSAITE